MLSDIHNKKNISKQNKTLSLADTMTIVIFRYCEFEFHPHYECVSPVLDFPETEPPSQTTDYPTAVLMGYLVVKET